MKEEEKKLTNSQTRHSKTHMRNQNSNIQFGSIDILICSALYVRAFKHIKKNEYKEKNCYLGQKTKQQLNDHRFFYNTPINL